MTLIGDKLKAAGVDTFEARFNVMCVEALRRFPDSIPQAWISIGNAFGHRHLLALAKDMAGQTKSGGPGASDTQSKVAAGARGGGGQTIHDTQNGDAAASARSVSVKEHERSKPFHKQKAKSDAAKEATLRATAEGSALWKDLKMERLRYRELDAFIREQIIAGGNHARKAHWQTKRAAVAWLVKQHGVPADPNALAKDCVSDKEAAKFLAMSERQAGLIIAKLVQQTATEIESGVKLIAAE